MAELSLKEQITLRKLRRELLRQELSEFIPGPVNICDRCNLRAPRAMLDGAKLCQECWKDEKAHLEGRLPRTGPIAPGAGNNRPASYGEDIAYHGYGATHTLGRVRKTNAN